MLGLDGCCVHSKLAVCGPKSGVNIQQKRHGVVPHRAGIPAIPPPYSGWMPTPQPQDFLGIPKHLFLPIPQDVFSCLPQEGSAPMLVKHTAKSLHPGHVCQWCLGGGQGWGDGHFSLLLSCFALGQSTDLPVSNPTSSFRLLDSGARGLITLFSAPGTPPVIVLHPMGHHSAFQVGGTCFVELIVL